MVAMNLNTGTYYLSGSSTSGSVTLTDDDTLLSSIIVYNAGSHDIFLVSGTTSAPTAVFPTSATAPLKGKVVGAGAIVTLTKNIGDRYIAGICSSTNTTDVYISPGSGE